MFIELEGRADSSDKTKGGKGEDNGLNMMRIRITIIFIPDIGRAWSFSLRLRKSIDYVCVLGYLWR